MQKNKGALRQGWAVNKNGDEKQNKDVKGKKNIDGPKKKVPRKCKKCNQVGFHDSRNCPNNS